MAALVFAEVAPSGNLTEQEALQVARKQLVSARPDLEIQAPIPGKWFVPAGPHSAGGPKWVIGFETTGKKNGKRWIYYVTVFPDGRTSEREIRPGAINFNGDVPDNIGP